MTNCRSTLVAAVLAALIAMPAIAAAQPDAAGTGELEPAKELFSLDIGKPGGLALDGKLLWVTDRLAGRIRGLDPATGEQKAELTAPGPWPTGLAFDGELLWVADKARNRLFGIDTRARIVRREVESPENPLGLAFDGRYLWVADGRRLHQVMREDGTTVVSFPAPTWAEGARRGDQLGLAFDRGWLWVSDRLSDRLYKVDPADGEVADILPAPGPFAAGLEIDGGRLLVVDVDRPRVVAVDLGALPRVERRDPRRQQVVLRREIGNLGPDTLAEVEIHVAIPASGPGQAIEGEPAFSPAPDGIVEDQWGQRFARFTARDLRPGKRLTVTMTVDATLFAVRHHIDPAQVGDLRSVPRNLKKLYLADAAKFALQHPSIRRHVKEALGDERRPWHMVRRISRYIGEHMEYELAGGWNIAPTVIDRGTGSCSEYTFVFIAMCRAAGIPARYAGAVVVRGDAASTDDVFHRWAEVWLPGWGWVPVDAQAADKPTAEQRAEGFGGLDNRFVITTLGGGDSSRIGWDYNSTAKWTCRGRCQIEDVHLGDWYPVTAAGQ